MKQQLILMFLAVLPLIASAQDNKKAAADEHYKEGFLNLVLGDAKKAIEEFDKTLAAKPDHADAYNYRGKAKGMLKQYEEAIKDIDKAIALVPGEDRYYYTRGVIWYAMGELEEAKRDMSKTLELNPKFREAFYIRGLVHTDQGDYSRAYVDLYDAMLLNEEDGNTLIALGKLMLTMGHKDDACEFLRKARAAGKSEANDLIMENCKESESDNDIGYFVKVPDAPMLDKTNAKNVKAYENTPESVVTYFYASRIRGDDKWKEVVIPESEWSERLKKQVVKYSYWNITEFQVREKQKVREGMYWVKVYFMIEMNGKKEGGEDDVTVMLINGKWMIVEIPT